MYWLRACPAETSFAVVFGYVFLDCKIQDPFRSSHPTSAVWKHTSSLDPPVLYQSMKTGIFVSQLLTARRRLHSSNTQSTEILTGFGAHIRKELQSECERRNMKFVTDANWSDFGPPSFGKWNHHICCLCSLLLLFFTATYLKQNCPDGLLVNGYVQVHKHVLFGHKKQIQRDEGQLSAQPSLSNTGQLPAAQWEPSQRDCWYRTVLLLLCVSKQKSRGRFTPFWAEITLAVC